MAEPSIEMQESEKNIEEVVALPIKGRIAIYDNIRSIPRVVDLDYKSISDFIDEIPQKTYSFSHDLGGKIPYTIIKEIIENLIHANFQEIIITIMDGGNRIIISDQGPGINEKDKAFLPGFSSASKSMKKYIRGVGSGLPIVRETIVFSGGQIEIEDNIKNGTVVSLKIPEEDSVKKDIDTASAVLGVPEKKDLVSPSEKQPEQTTDLEFTKLTLRQIKILSLILEVEETGPSGIAKELGFSLSTSYRELVFLESLQLLELTETGKRILTDKGKKYLEYYSNNF